MNIEQAKQLQELSMSNQRDREGSSSVKIESHSPVLGLYPVEIGEEKLYTEGITRVESTQPLENEVELSSFMRQTFPVGAQPTQPEKVDTPLVHIGHQVTEVIR
jgi:hypothetical protein